MPHRLATIHSVQTTDTDGDSQTQHCTIISATILSTPTVG